MKTIDQYLPTLKIKGKSLQDLMKTKNFYFMLLFLTVVALSTWLLVYPSPNIHSIVSETHKQISNIKNIPSNIRNTDAERLAVNQKYLDVLGFKLSKEGQPRNKLKKDRKASPVVVVPAKLSSYEEVKKFFLSVQKYLPEKFVVFYDLGLGGKEATLVGIFLYRS